MEAFNKDFREAYYKYYNLKKKCINKHLVPKFAKYNITTKITNKQYTNIRLKNEIKFLYKKK